MNKPYYNDLNNRKTINIGRYRVVEDKKNKFYGIYHYNELITSRQNWNSACKLAKLLDKIYNEGYNDNKDNYDY